MRDRKQGNDEDEEGASDGPESPVSFDHYDWNGSDRPSVAVAEAVAAVTNRAVTALPPLQDTVDADALDTVMESGDETVVRASFAYAGTEVAVASDGRIEISP